MIHSSADGAVTTIELRRAERRNALNLDLCNALCDAVGAAVAGGTRAVVITGEGTSFCSGADLDDVYGEEFIAALYGLLGHLREAPVPIVAAVNGPAIGAGTQLAMACDLRVVAPSAAFAIPTATNGLAVDAWTIRTLAALAGGGVARAVMLGCERLDADRALSCGLADRAGGLDVATAWAREIAGWAPLTLAYNKLVLNGDAHDSDVAEYIDAGWLACWGSEDIVEARTARAERRAPVFRGR